MSSRLKAFTLFTLVCVACASAAMVEGTVTDQSTSDPVEGASVVLSSRFGGAEDISTTTDEVGGYLLEDVNRGFYTLTVSADGYQDARENVQITGAGQEVVRDVDLLLEGMEVTGSLTGMVADVESEESIRDAMVILLEMVGPDETAPVDTQTTNMEGTYLFEEVPVGDNYAIAVSADGYAARVVTGIRIREGETRTRDVLLQAEAEPSSAIAGTVTDEDTQEAVAEATVILREGAVSGGGQYTWEVLDSTTSAADGAYGFETLQAATMLNPYSIVVFADGYRTFSSDPIVVADEDTVTEDVLLVAIATGNMHLFVGDEEDESPLEGASVSAVLDGEGGEVYAGLTNEDGWVVFADVVTGRYAVTAAHVGYATESTVRSVSTDEEDSGYVLLAASEPGETKTVSGIVRDAEGGAVEGAEVTLTLAGQTPLVLLCVSTATGDYAIEGIPMDYSAGVLTVTADGYNEVSEDVDLDRAAVTINVTFEGPTGGILSSSSVSGRFAARTSVRQGRITLFLRNVSAPGTAAVYASDGRVLYRCSVRAGSGHVRLPRTVARGNTVLYTVVSSGSHTVRQKVLLVK